MHGTDTTDVRHATPALAEAARLMNVCNSCRYCEGLCAVFPAMEMRRTFADGDLDYLANLCHACGACYVDCQFSPPHEFDVNVPKVLAQVRAESWGRHVWPGALCGVFDRNGLWIALSTAVGVAGFIGGFVLLADARAFFGGASGPGVIWEGRGHTEADSRLPDAAPENAARKLTEALFQGFPGESGRTITVK